MIIILNKIKQKKEIEKLMLQNYYQKIKLIKSKIWLFNLKIFKKFATQELENMTY